MVLLAISIAYARQYLSGAREVKRLGKFYSSPVMVYSTLKHYLVIESISKSPIIQELDSILCGLTTIRAWHKFHVYVSRMFSMIDAHARCIWHIWLFNRWLGIRFAAIGAIFTFIVASLAVYSPHVSASLAGLALAFSLECSHYVFWFLRHYADVELDMNSVERVTEFCDIPAEPANGVVPPAHWPSSGRLEVSDLVIGYASELPAVLRGISFCCEPNNRVGIVGRAGAEKSSHVGTVPLS